MILTFSAAEWEAYARKHFGPDSKVFSVAFEPVRIDRRDLGWKEKHWVERDTLEFDQYVPQPLYL